MVPLVDSLEHDMSGISELLNMAFSQHEITDESLGEVRGDRLPPLPLSFFFFFWISPLIGDSIAQVMDYFKRHTHSGVKRRMSSRRKKGMNEREYGIRDQDVNW